MSTFVTQQGFGRNSEKAPGLKNWNCHRKRNKQVSYSIMKFFFCFWCSNMNFCCSDYKLQSTTTWPSFKSARVCLCYIVNEKTCGTFKLPRKVSDVSICLCCKMWHVKMVHRKVMFWKRMLCGFEQQAKAKITSSVFYKLEKCLKRCMW